MAKSRNKKRLKTKGLPNLPPELWSRICKLAVIQQAPIKLFEASKRRGPGTLKTDEPGITKVCRAIRQECLDHFYKSNIFYGCAKHHWTFQLDGCLLWLGQPKTQAMERIYVVHVADPRQPVPSLEPNIGRFQRYKVQCRDVPADEVKLLTDTMGENTPEDWMEHRVYCLEFGPF